MRSSPIPHLRRQRIYVRSLIFVCALCLSIAYIGDVLAQKRVVYVSSSELSMLEPRRDRVVEELRRLGHLPQRDFSIAIRSYNNDLKQLATIAASIVAEKPDLIYAGAWDAASALKSLTTTIPIVFAARANLESPTFRIVANLSAPEANITGFTRYVNLVPKKLQLLKEAFPEVRRVGFVYGVDFREERRREYEQAAERVGIQLVWRKYSLSDLANLATQLNALTDDAFLVAYDDFVIYNRPAYVAQLAKVTRPIFFPEESTSKGVLMHYVPVMDGEAKAAEYISKLLRGAKVSDLAVQEPQEFDFSVNMTTLRRNGLTMSRDVLARARKVE